MGNERIFYKLRILLSYELVLLIQINKEIQNQFYLRISQIIKFERQQFVKERFILDTEMDISEPKSRTFNMYLRYFQIGLQVLIASKLSQINSTSCEQTFQKIGFFTCLIIIFINLVAMIVTYCSHQFPRFFFFVMFILNIILSAIILVLGIAGMTQYNSCANNRVLYRFVIIEGLISVVLAIMIIILPFHWIQRYSNTPGNLVWIFIFFGFSWTPQYRIPMLILGIVAAAISSMSFLVNIIACRGITTTIKKIIVIEWVFALVLMVIGQIIALVVYLQIPKTQQFTNILGTKSLLTFICVNFLDLIFWLWGYMTLQYQNGDKIRDQLMRGREQQQYQEDVGPYYIREQVERPGFGTIRH